MKNNHKKKIKDKNYVPLWWVILIFIVSLGFGDWVDQDGAFGRYLEQRKIRKQEKKLAKKVKKQDNHE